MCKIGEPDGMILKKICNYITFMLEINIWNLKLRLWRLIVEDLFQYNTSACIVHQSY